MKYEDFNYIRFTQGLERGQILSLDKYVAEMKDRDLGTSPNNNNLFRSINRYTKSILHHFHSQDGSAKKYGGVHVADYAVADTDSKGDTPQEGIEYFFRALDKLEKIWGLTPKDLDLYLSGSKGCHILIPAGIFLPNPHPKFSKIHRSFIEKIYGLDWVSTKGVIDPTLFDPIRIFRIAGTKNAKKKVDEDERPRGFKVRLNLDHLNALREDWRIVYELWKEPTCGEGATSTEVLTGEYYWNFKENTELSSLWQTCQKEIEVATPKRAKKKKTSICGSRANIDSPPPCITHAMDDIITGNVEGKRNSLTAALSVYYHTCGLNKDDAFKRVEGLMSRHYTSDFSQLEVVNTFKSCYDGGYPMGCGTGQANNWNLAEFCTDTNNPQDCPKYKERHENENTESEENATEGKSYVLAGQAFNVYVKKVKEFREFRKSGGLLYWLGLGAIDQFTGPLVGDSRMIVQQAFPNVGKSRLSFLEMHNLIPAIKDRNEIFVFLSPEGKTHEVAGTIAQQVGQYTIEDVFMNEADIESKSQQWFDTYDKNLVIRNVAGFSVKDCIELFKEVEAREKKKIAVVLYDGVTFVQGSSSKTNRHEEAAIGLSQAIASDRFDCAGIFNVHVPKDEGKGAKNDDIRNVCPPMGGGHGTIFWANAGGAVFSLYKVDKLLAVLARKIRTKWKGQSNDPERELFVPDRFYRLFGLEDGLKLFQENPDLFDFNVEKEHAKHSKEQEADL
jgi:hypothetical protein